MLSRIGRRLLQAIVVLFLVSACIFSIGEFLPGDIAARVLGRETTPAQREAFREERGLNDPILIRYGEWIGGVVTGNLGSSLVSGRPVADIIGPRTRNSLRLAVLATVIYVPLTLIIGIASAVRKGRRFDRIASGVTLVALSIPEFVMAALLIIVFAVWLGWLPAISLPATGSLIALVRPLILPAIALVAIMSSYAIRMLRESMIEVLSSDHVTAARLRGIPEWRVLLRHALPTAIGPTLAITALNMTYLIGGVVIVEQVFSYPGLGRLLIEAISIRDTPIAMVVVLMGSVAFIVSNLLADIVAYVTNPRLEAI